MQDKLNSALEMSGVTVRIDGVTMQAQELAEPVVVRSRVRGGSAITVGMVNGKITIRGNPIGFLSGQNVWGSCDMPRLNLQLFTELRNQGILSFTDLGWNSIVTGDYAVHEIAFAQYVRCKQDQKFNQMVQLKALYASVISNWEGHSLHMYDGHGFIVRKRNMTLCVYDKRSELDAHAGQRDLNTRLVGDLDRLDNVLRFEVTLKYNWMQSRNCLRVKDWSSKVTDWEQEARKIVLQGCQQFRFEYLIDCPNVFHPDYVKDWSDTDREIYRRWRQQRPMTAADHKRMHCHHLWSEIGARAHEQLLWQRLRPGVDVAASITGDTRTLLSEAEAFNRSRIIRDRLCGSFLPLARSIKGSGPRKQVDKVLEHLNELDPESDPDF